MNSSLVIILIILGLVLTLTGVGGIEFAETNKDLVASTATTIFGLITLIIGVIHIED